MGGDRKHVSKIAAHSDIEDDETDVEADFNLLLLGSIEEHEIKMTLDIGSVLNFLSYDSYLCLSMTLDTSEQYSVIIGNAPLSKTVGFLKTTITLGNGIEITIEINHWIF